MHPHSSDRNQYPKGKGKGKGYSRPHNKEEGKGQRQTSGRRNKDKEPCSYCKKDDHEARECRKRLFDENQGTQKKGQTNNALHVHPIQVRLTWFS
jgi:hypothetical protein